MKMLLAASAALIALVGCKGPAEEAPTEAGAGGVAMAPEAQARMGVKIAALAAAKARPVALVYARVLDAGPLAQLQAEAASARAVAEASAAQARRVEALAAADQSASPKAVESARAQAIADEARAAFAEQRIGLEWGPGLAGLGAAGRAQILSQTAAGRAALVRVDAPGVVVKDIKAIRLRMTRDGAAITAALLGPAIAADPRLQAPGLFAIVRGAGAAALPAGRLLYGEVETGAEETGVLVPRAAIVRMSGAAWVYAPIGSDKFARRELIDARPLADGFFARLGFKPGDMIVVDGAGALLAVERGPEEE